MTMLPPGTYVLVEYDGAGTTSTTSNEIPLVLTTESSTTNLFLDATAYTISGTVFSDRNGNGTKDGSEPGLSGITVTGVKSAAAALTKTTTTAPDGTFTLTALTVGSYAVSYGVPTGFVATSPASGSATVAITSASATGIDFGARQTNLQITASAIDDVNANAAADAGETASAATITLYRDTNGDGSLTLGTDEVVLADQVGTLSKTGLSPDTYFLVETDVTDYVDTGSVVASSGPSTKVGLDQFTIVLTDTSSLGNTFLDALGTASITGFVYSDLNGSGGWNAGEPVKSGVTLSLVKGGTTTTTLSGADGVFTFGSLTTGTYTLTAALAGWTVKGTTSYTVVLAAGEAATGKDFYLQQSNLVISGTVYQDNNADGIDRKSTRLNSSHT